MSDFVDMLVEMLPMHSELQKEDNPFRKVLDRTVGAYMDDFEIPYEQIFLTSATGGWLDAHGKDYGIPRKIDETDEHYRERIIYEKLDHLTPQLLKYMYNVELFTYRDDFDVENNTLVSDNPYLLNKNVIGLSDEQTLGILDKKFIVDNTITWINDIGAIDLILDKRGINILNEYSKVYSLTDLNGYFIYKDDFSKVKLYLPNAETSHGLLYSCSSLIDVGLNLPNTIYCPSMIKLCSALVNADLDLPKAEQCYQMFQDCSSLKNVNLNLPKAEQCQAMFQNCSSLVDIDLKLNNLIHCEDMFKNCSSLKNAKLSMNKVTGFYGIFQECNNLETINVIIPSSVVDDFKIYISNLNLPKLTSLIINGEEQL